MADRAEGTADTADRAASRTAWLAVLVYGTLPKTEFKAKRVRDLREP